MKVRICVSAEKIPDFVSWQIMRRLGFEGSHIFVVYKDRMYHSVDAGICDEDFKAFCLTHHITHEKVVELPCEEEDFFLWYRAHQGTAYSQSQYVGFIFPWLRWFVRNKRKKAICSEFVAWLMRDLALRTDFEDADFLSPKDVFERI